MKKQKLKKIKSLTKHWEENPKQLNDLIEKRKMWKCKVYYIEQLIKNKNLLSINSKGILTPYAYYFPDFEFTEKYIEIKSEYTYNIL